jgi:uroporphyrin-III C-methyltransferase
MTEPQSPPAPMATPAPEPVAAPKQAAQSPQSAPVVAPAAVVKGSRLTLFLIAACALSLGTSGMLWLKLGHIQETLARQSLDASTQSVEAKTLAKAAQDTVRETAARQSMMEARISEVALQRSQLEELMQSLSRSRDENLVVDIDSAVRLAQQQTSLTGSAEPLLAALRAADQRIARAAQPRLVPLQRAITKDIERIKTTTLADTPGLLLKLDELNRVVDDLPLANAVAHPTNNAAVRAAIAAKPVAKGASAAASNVSSASELPSPAQWPQWLQNIAGAVRDEARGLVRVSRIDTPEAALLSPEQGFFARENLKLKILNARLGLLARQSDASRADLAQAATTLTRYFDGNARATQQAQAVLVQLQAQMKTVEMPRIDDTLAALATAAAGR